MKTLKHPSPVLALAAALAASCPGASAQALDPTTEGALIDMGAANAPSRGAAAPKIARAPAAPSGDESGTDYAGIGSLIINPGAAAAPAAAPKPSPGARSRAAAFSRLESDSPRTFTKVTGLSYLRLQKIEAATGDGSTGLGALVNDFKSGVSDPKLKGGNEDLTPGGTRASSNAGD